MQTVPHLGICTIAAGFAIAICSVCAPRTACADPLRLRGDAIATTSSPVGLVMLQGEDRSRPWIDAEAVAWLGAGIVTTPGVTGDALVLTIRLRDPKGRGEIRAGRFVYSAGAIRPLHIDGARALGRVAATGTSVEVFGGTPVVPRFGDRPFDLAVGGRVAQTAFDALTIGAAYLVRRRDGAVLDREVGPDLAIAPTPWLDVAARAAFDLVHRGPTDALASVAVRSGDLRVEGFATHRSPARLLPATSLFSVLGNVPSTTSGGTLRYRAAPRLDLIGTAAAVGQGDELGGYATGRALLALDDAWAGTLGLEVRRQSFGATQWSGVRVLARVPLTTKLAATTEVELVRPDRPPGASPVWPWALLALSYRLPSGWDGAVAVETLRTRDDRTEVHALGRVAWSYDRLLEGRLLERPR